MSDSHRVYRPSRNYLEALDRAAELWDISAEYLDVMGKAHRTSAETKKGILAALGVQTDTREQLDHAVEQRLLREWTRLSPPVLVLAGEEAPRELPLHIPAEAGPGFVRMEIELENGTGMFRSELPLADLSSRGKAEIGHHRFLRKAAPLPEELPLGYHDAQVRVEMEGGGKMEAQTRLIICPARAYSLEAAGIRRAAGLAISLYALRSDRNWGCGDMTDLESFTDWLAQDAGASFIGLNPLHAIPNRQPFNTSPYLPTSIFYKNPIYLDVERIEDFQNSPRARKALNLPEVQAEIQSLRSSTYVEYERVYRLKLRILKLAFLAFLREYRKNSARAADFKQYVAREGELLDYYAIFSALDEWIHARRPDIWVWTDWPEEYRDPDSIATKAFAKKRWRRVMFYQYLQWQLDLQLEAAHARARQNGLSIGLFHDLALATDRYGGDLWSQRSFYVAGCRVGAPPDEFAPKGQDWSFPPPYFERHREDGYRLFTDTIRKNCRHGGALRIDHVMRFFRLYWIPEGKQPDEGAYVLDRSEEILPIVALESVRNRVIVVGEDLGTVTPQIRAALSRYGILGYKVPYFEKHENGEFRLPQDYSEQALVTSATHDLPTLAGFWLGRDIEARRYAGLIDECDWRQQLTVRAEEKRKLLALLFQLKLLPEWYPRKAEEISEFTGELHNALIGLLANARPKLFALAQEDLVKDLDQQNLPASTWQYPNWRRKMRFTVEELRSNQFARDCTAMFRKWLERSGRLNRPPFSEPVVL